MKHTKHLKPFDLANGTPPIAKHNIAWEEWAGRYKLLRDKMIAHIIDSGKK